MPDSQKISEKQSEYMNLIAEIMDIRKRGEKPVAYIRTYGCQQNVADSEKIKGMLEQSGFEFADEPDNADFILFNTCAVREHAEDRVFGNVGALKNLKRKHPQILIALCGCMMEQEHVANKIYKSFPFVGLVFGTHSLHHFPELMTAKECLKEVMTITGFMRDFLLSVTVLSRVGYRLCTVATTSVHIALCLM